MLALLSSGSNAQGQLAIGSFEDSNIFQRCSFEGCPPGTLPTGTRRILTVAAGSNHTIVLLEVADTDTHVRELWGCGDGRKGQLGPRLQTSFNDNRPNVFTRIEFPFRELGLPEYCFKAVSSTWETSYVVLAHQHSDSGASDVVVTMGSNDFGDLGVEEGSSTHTKTKPINGIYVPQIQSFASELGTAWTIAVDHISTGQRHIVAHLTVSRNDAPSLKILIGWGTSRHGQLGISSSPSRKPPVFYRLPQEIPCSHLEGVPILSSLGIHHSVFLHSSGRVSTLGSDRKGQLRAGMDTQYAQQIACTWNGTYVVTQSGSRWCVSSSGSNSHGQLGRGDEAADRPVGNISFVGVDPEATSIHLAAGSEHVLALIINDNAVQNQPSSEVWAWGWNEHGNLGLGHTTDISMPIHIWPAMGSAGYSGDVKGIWGGCGTSWMSCEVEN